MPAAVQARMERAFAADFSAVRIHEGNHPLDIGAVAYTQGTDIHMAPGHYDPLGSRGQELLGHELAHVVQQQQGRVQPTTSVHGRAVNADAGLETEADRAGQLAAAGNRIGDLGGSGNSATCPAAQRKVIQRTAVPTHFGTFNDEEFVETREEVMDVDAVDDQPPVHGVKIKLTFAPNDKANARKIGLVQSVKNIVHGNPIALDPTKRRQMVPGGPAKGYGIDKHSNQRNPLYAASAPLSDHADQLKDYDTVPFQGEHGHRFHDGNDWQVQDAVLHDSPTCPTEPHASLTFETTALAIDGEQNGTYYGSVSWGIQADGNGKLGKVELQKVSDGVPSSNFMLAAKQWNASRTQGTLMIARDGVELIEVSDEKQAQEPGEKSDLKPDEEPDEESAKTFALNKNVVVYQQDSGLSGGVVYLKVRVNSNHPICKDKVGYVLETDVVDRGDGEDTLKLPIVE